MSRSRMMGLACPKLDSAGFKNGKLQSNINKYVKSEVKIMQPRLACLIARECQESRYRFLDQPLARQTILPG